ncbi:class I adenylate-forming enzyme family protein [Rhodococcus gannanensis]|uniref:Class I adenylate-forming enzyme family protein n=1 Tax=Rhodococcus gannanensis TaxID=1960308 RepID=A0ABW4P4S9_9NOCA
MTDSGLATASATHRLARRLEAVLALDPDAGAIEYEGDWTTWGQIAELARRVGDVCRRHGGDSPTVGILLRNRPSHVAAFLGVLLTGGCVVTINPARGDARTRSDIASLELALVIGDADDLANLVDPATSGTLVALGDVTDALTVTVSGHLVGNTPTRPGVAVRMLTSGTTGPPKRVDLTYDMLAHSVLGPPAATDTPPTTLSSGVAIVNAPLVHIGGVFRTLQCVVAARPYVLLPRFEIESWAEAVRRYRPRAVSLVPAAVRTVLHSSLTRDDLASIIAVTSGTAPLSAEDADAFTEKFGIPVLTSYAATEFGGGVAGWSLADHREFWAAKRGSAGRATGGARLRVVADDGTVLEPDRIGLLEVKPGQLGPATDWIRTTDLARIDADGFVWVVGRADQAVIRGGFKVIPDDVRVALENHPAVEGAAVVGRPHDRLGAVPVAMIELRPGASVSVAEIEAFLAERLARYEIPTEFSVVAAIPRTPSGKADLAAVRDQFDGGSADGE